MGKNDWKSAIASLGTAIELAPQFANAYEQRAACYGQIGDTRQAEANHQKAIELDPSIGK